jgi:hypothetical protein
MDIFLMKAFGVQGQPVRSYYTKPFIQIVIFITFFLCHLSQFRVHRYRNLVLSTAHLVMPEKI